MSNIDNQAYRADGGDIGTGRLKEIADTPYGDEEKCWLAKRVLALLDELEAMHKYAKDRDAENEGLMVTVGRLRGEKEAAEKRIAELEARTVTLPAQKYCPGEYADSVLWGETEVWNQAISEFAKAIRGAGIGLGE